MNYKQLRKISEQIQLFPGPSSHHEFSTFGSRLNDALACAWTFKQILATCDPFCWTVSQILLHLVFLPYALAKAAAVAVIKAPGEVRKVSFGF